jgi:hypothetical protein
MQNVPVAVELSVVLLALAVTMGFVTFRDPSVAAPVTFSVPGIDSPVESSDMAVLPLKRQVCAAVVGTLVHRSFVLMPML